jgi:AcrR family transcriptional regulator
MTQPSGTRRADAERNRERILAVARDAFATGEAAISMAEISRRAGVGMATLYRNFPGRRELLEALYTDEVEGVIAAAATVEGNSPGARFGAWLRRFLAFSAGKRHVAHELLASVEGAGALLDDNRARVLAAGGALLTAAQASHEVRDDLTLEQILDMIIAIARIQGGAAYVEPILATALAGLRPAT